MLLAGLNEDHWQWDWTSLGIAEPLIEAEIWAKEDGVWAAEGLLSALASCVSEMVKLVDFSVSTALRNGDEFKAGNAIVKLKGSPRIVLAIERPCINLMAYSCGIASSTRKLVALVRAACPNNAPRVTATRKTLPRYKDLAIHSVMTGGGFSHRVNLAGGVLIKENHIASAGGIERAVSAAKAFAPHGLKIEVEVRSTGELELALRTGVDGVLLDNFSVEQVHSALKIINAYQGSSRHRVVVEVSGGLNEENISNYAIEGVDILSVGSLTHSVRSVDLSLLVKGAKK